MKRLWKEISKNRFNPGLDLAFTDKKFTRKWIPGNYSQKTGEGNFHRSWRNDRLTKIEAVR